VLIVNQQVPGSITNEDFIEQANRLFAEFADKVVLLDSRHCGEKFKHVCRKTNEREAPDSTACTSNLVRRRRSRT